MIRLRTGFFALGCTVSLVANAPNAQGQPLRPLGTVFLRTDSVEIGLRSRSIWRGIELGSYAAFAGLHIGLWQIDGVTDKHAVTGRAAMAIPVVNRSRVIRGDLTELYAGYRYRIDTEQGETNLGYADRRFAFPSAVTHRAAIEATLQHRIEAPLTELRPILGVLASRETVRDPATRVEGKIVLDAGLPPKENNAASYGGRLEFRPAFSTSAKVGDGTRSMRFHDAVLGLWLSGDRSTSPVGPVMAELGFELGHTRVPTNVTYGQLAIRGVVR